MIVELKDLNIIKSSNPGKKIVFAGGVFDVFHPTHIRAIKNLKKFGDILVIGLVSDVRVKERKGDKRPILKQNERLEILDAIKYIDYIVEMPEPNNKYKYPTIKVLDDLKPDVFVSVDKRWLDYKNIIEEKNIKLEILDRIHETSSTSIINRIIEKYC